MLPGCCCCCCTLYHHPDLTTNPDPDSVFGCVSSRSQPRVPLTSLATATSVKQAIIITARSGRGVKASTLSAEDDDGMMTGGAKAAGHEPRREVIASLHCYSLVQVSCSQRLVENTSAERLVNLPRLDC